MRVATVEIIYVPYRCLVSNYKYAFLLRFTPAAQKSFSLLDNKNSNKFPSLFSFLECTVFECNIAKCNTKDNLVNFERDAGPS